MNVISNLLVRSRRNFHVIVIIALSIVLIKGAYKTDQHVAHFLISALYTPFSLAKNSVNDLFRGAEEVYELRAALVEASMRVSQLQELGRENSRLRSVLGFEPPENYAIVPARVIAIDRYARPSFAVIDRGESDSVLTDMSVINQDGLVGRIVSVSSHTAVVQLLTDPLNRVAARIASSREMGIAKYITSGRMILDNLPVQGTVFKSDTVVSSGLGGVYPSGLLIGQVALVERPENASFCKIELRPAVNFHSIEELFVLRPL